MQAAQESEAHMRKNTTFAIVATIMGLAMIVWAKSSVVTTHAEVTKASKRLDPAHAWWYTHTDPGPLWPRRLFMRLVRQYHAAL